MQFITLLDYFLLPIYLFIIYGIANIVRNTQYSIDHPWRKYFIAGLTCKIVGALLIGMIYQYYYGGGDTANYFYHAQIINSSFSDSFTKWINLVMRVPAWYDGEYSKYISHMYWYESPTEYTVAAIAAVIGIFTGTTFLPISVIMGAISYTGSWALFRTFATKYPAYTKYAAWCTLFIPSTVMWGSGLFKDTICMFGVGWMTYGAFRMLISRDFSIKNIILTVISFILVANIKLYILLAFIPALVLWILFTYSHKIQSTVTRNMIKISVVLACIGGFLVFSQKFAAELGRFSLDNVAQTSYALNTYIAGESGAEGSTYNLGALDPSIGGMLKKFPAAVNVSLFRPYIWETRKPLQLLNAVEASLFLWVTIKLFIVVGFRKVWQTLLSDPTVQFCLIFTIIFAFAVGLSSGNFGTLSRYRIPCLPFFGMALVVLYYRNRPADDNILALRLR